MQFLTVSVFSLLWCCVVRSLEAPYNFVVGSVVTSCGHPTFHSVHSTPYPIDNGDNTSVWIRDSDVRCFRTVSEILAYCQKVYGTETHSKVNQVVLDPFRHSVPKHPLYSSQSANANLRRYMCLHSSTPPVVSPDLLLDSLETASATKPLQTPVPHSTTPFPTLIDVHKAFFSERLLQLSSETKSNVSQLIHRMITDSEGLRHLQDVNSASDEYLPSQMLHKAREALEHIWEKEEEEWFKLESEQHRDLVRQLESADWASENEFVYVMQEFNTDLNRVQDALTILLSRLADSVQEEVRHLDLVRTKQPWTLRLDHESANWTTTVIKGVVNLENVHQALVKHVHTATSAINTVRSLMAAATRTSQATSYKPSLIDSYNKLQRNLLEAQRVLNEAKATFLQHLQRRMHSNLNSIGANMGEGKDSSSIFDHTYLHDWIQSKHHEELAVIDMITTQLFAAATRRKNRQSDRADDQSSETRKTFIINLILYSLLALTMILIGGVVFMATCYHCVFRRTGVEEPSAASARKLRAKLHQFLLLRSNKLKHWWQYTNQPVSIATTPNWKVGPPVVLVSDSKCRFPQLDSPSYAVNPATEPAHSYIFPIDQKTTTAGLFHGYRNPSSPVA